MTAAWLDRLNRQWHNTKRHRIPKARAWLVIAVPAIYLPGGWGLITWSAFGWNARAWAASLGVLMMVNVALRFIAVYVASKRNALRRPNA